MGGRKVTLTFTEDIFNRFAALAERDGFNGVPAIVRHFAVTGVNFATDKKAVRLTVDDDIADYARQKKFGSTESFLTFAANSYMNKYPLTEAQKAKVDK